jgi:predicted TIM-barrel fold metal-dependent hydrolase
MKEGWDLPEGWTGLHGELETFDNSALTLYDMQRYGVDMCILLPSIIGTTNEMQAKLVDRYPNKFRACCSDQKLKIKVWRGEAEWTLEAALEEVETALKTGKFVGIGEFAPGMHPGLNIRKTPPTYRQRLDEFRTFMDLAAKYGVVVDWHERPLTVLSQVSREYPDVPIVFCHGGHSESGIRAACGVAGRAPDNIYLETGGWPAEYFEIPLKNPNVTATQLIWGHDYGNVPQYLVARPGQTPSMHPILGVKRWPLVPSYQTDWWGWSLHQIRKLKDWVTQDEINLILGGNAAKIFKLPVPYQRMFPEGRPDLWGIHWQKSIPLIPKGQVQHPDYP